jgi:hypothetical protein
LAVDSLEDDVVDESLEADAVSFDDPLSFDVLVLAELSGDSDGAADPLRA